MEPPKGPPPQPPQEPPQGPPPQGSAAVATDGRTVGPDSEVDTASGRPTSPAPAPTEVDTESETSTSLAPAPTSAQKQVLEKVLGSAQTQVVAAKASGSSSTPAAVAAGGGIGEVIQAMSVDEAAANSIYARAAERGPGSATVAADGRIGLELAVANDSIYELEFFLKFSCPRGLVAKRDHNKALKCFRYTFEDKTDPWKSEPVLCQPFNRLCECHHAAKGMQFDFPDSGEEWWWSWLSMVAQLCDEDLREVVTGPDGRSRGLLSCWVAIRPNSYDNARHEQLKDKGAQRKDKLPCWDFLLIREGGTGVRLHPSWDSNKVKAYAIEGEAEPVEPPHGIPGGTWGPGTYHYFKTLGVSKTYRFDHNKCA